MLNDTASSDSQLVSLDIIELQRKQWTTDIDLVHSPTRATTAGAVEGSCLTRWAQGLSRRLLVGSRWLAPGPTASSFVDIVHCKFCSSVLLSHCCVISVQFEADAAVLQYVQHVQYANLPSPFHTRISADLKTVIQQLLRVTTSRWPSFVSTTRVRGAAVPCPHDNDSTGTSTARGVQAHCANFVCTFCLWSRRLFDVAHHPHQSQPKPSLIYKSR